MIKLFEEFEYHPGKTSVNQVDFCLRLLWVKILSG